MSSLHRLPLLATASSPAACLCNPLTSASCLGPPPPHLRLLPAPLPPHIVAAHPMLKLATRRIARPMHASPSPPTPRLHHIPLLSPSHPLHTSPSYIPSRKKHTPDTSQSHCPNPRLGFQSMPSPQSRKRSPISGSFNHLGSRTKLDLGCPTHLIASLALHPHKPGLPHGFHDKGDFLAFQHFANVPLPLLSLHHSLPPLLFANLHPLPTATSSLHRLLRLATASSPTACLHNPLTSASCLGPPPHIDALSHPRPPPSPFLPHPHPAAPSKQGNLSS